MSNKKSDLDKLEEAVDQVLSPERAVRWLVRILVLLIVLGVVFTLGKLAMHMVGRVDKGLQEVETLEREAEEAAERATRDHNWFVLQKDAIDMATVGVKAAMDALDRHRVVVENRPMFSFTGKKDATETARLRGVVSNAQGQRLLLIRDYNESATVAKPSTLRDLPSHIDVIEVPVTMTEVDGE